MSKLSIIANVSLIIMIAIAQTRGPAIAQVITFGQDKGVQLPPTVAPTALAAYTKWRADTLLNYPQGLLTPHYAVAIVAERLNDNTAQVEMLIAAEMKNYTVTIKPVTLTRLASGETTTTVAGKVVTIDQKAGEKLGTGADKIRIGQTTTLISVSRTVQALEITWAPKNDKPDDPSNACIVRLGKEPAVVVNGYIVGAPVR